MSALAFAWTTPSKQEQPYTRYRVHTVKPGTPLYYITSARMVTCCMTHHIDSRTKGCMNADCDGCAMNAARRLKGWLPAFIPGSNSPFIVELSDNACRIIEAEVLAGRDIRMSLFKHYRLGNHKNSKQQIDLLPFEDKTTETMWRQRYAGYAWPPKAPLHFDLIPTLLALWGFSHKDIANWVRNRDNGPSAS